jgi:hypothetical protein
VLAILLAWGAWETIGGAAQRSDGQLTIEVVDADSGQPVAARMHLNNSRGRPISPRLPGTAGFGGHFYIDGRATLPLRVGQYTFQLDSGPEYRTQSGHFEIQRHADDSKRIEMKRFANLREEGWYGGDLDVIRRQADLPLIMRAEGLNIVPVQQAEAGRQSRRSTRLPAEAFDTEDDRANPTGPIAEIVPTAGGDVLLFHSTATAEGAAHNDVPRTSLEILRDARGRGAQVVARTSYAWDLPVWLASGELDAIGLIHHHALFDSVVDNEDDGRPRDKKLFPGSRGNGRWSEAVYHHALNCGFRVPPAAGSGSGSNDSPVGTNRVYAFCGEEFSEESWWAALEAGRVVVTNGPLLRPVVEGHPPGYVFRLDAGNSLKFEIGLELATRTAVEYLQIIKNGEVAAEVRLADWAKKQGRLPPLEFDASGWFLVRAITDHDRKYQFASSGPYFVDQEGKPRISRRSVRFFLDWIDAAVARLKTVPNLDDRRRKELLAEQETARQHFQQLLADANTE